MRKTVFDVLTNVEMIVKRLQRTNGLFRYLVNKGKEARKVRAI